jgi:hypothetical protein
MTLWLARLLNNTAILVKLFEYGSEPINRDAFWGSTIPVAGQLSIFCQFLSLSRFLLKENPDLIDFPRIERRAAKSEGYSFGLGQILC